MEPSAACSERLSATLPFHQLSQDLPLEQDVVDVDGEEIMFSMPSRVPVQCSDGVSVCSYLGNIKQSATCSERLSAPLSFQQLSPYEQDIGDEELVTQFYQHAPVRCSDDRLDEQFADFSIDNFDKAKSELVCSNNG